MNEMNELNWLPNTAISLIRTIAILHTIDINELKARAQPQGLHTSPNKHRLFSKALDIVRIQATICNEIL